MKKIIIILLLIHNSPVAAETLWKLGAGIGNITANSYPGSDETETVTSPIPYLKIKTEWFDLDREGLHTNWFKDTKFRVDFTFDLGLPVESENNSLRTGMDDLDPVGLIGPMLIYQLEDSEHLKWQLQLPLAYAYAFNDLDAQSIGWSINPRIYFNYLIKNSGYPIDVSVSLGPVYNSGQFNQYYYTVEVADVMAGRDEYQSEEGNAGYRFNFSVTQRMDSYWLGFYLRYQNISDAVFVDSPLVSENDYWFVAIGASWLFAGNL